MPTVPEEGAGAYNPLQAALSAPDEPAAPVASIGASLRESDADPEISRLEVSRQQAVDRDPMQAARVMRLASQTGLPDSFIEQDVDGIDKIAQERNFSAAEFRAQSPKFAAWLARNPNHFALAKEDLGFFAGLEKVAVAFAAGTQQVPAQEERAALLNRERLGQASEQEIRRSAQLKLEEGLRAKEAKGDSAAAYAARQAGYSGRQLASTIAAGAKGYMAGAPVGAVIGSALPGVGTLAGFGAGGVAGGFTASARYSYEMETAFAWDEYRSIPGMDPATANAVARGVGLLNAAIETGSEYMLLALVPGANVILAGGKAALTNRVKAALAVPTIRTAITSAVTKMTQAGLIEGLEEFVQALTGSAGREVAQSAAGGGAMADSPRFATKMPEAKPQFPPDSAAQDFKSAGEQALAAFTGMFLTGGLTHGGPQFFVQLKEARQAQAAQAFYSALAQGAESQAYKNLPEKHQEIVREIVKDGKLETSYVDVPTWETYWQGKGLDPREVAAEVMGEGQSFDQAKEAGHPLPIPTDRYARKLATIPEHAKFFAEEMRTSPDAMNGREVTELFQAAKEDEELMKAEDHFIKEQSAEESGKAVIDNVTTQLKEAGYDDRTARTLASVYSGFRALGVAADVDPLELFSKYDPKIRRQQNQEEAAGQKSLFQRATDKVRSLLGLEPAIGEWESDKGAVDGEMAEFFMSPGGEELGYVTLDDGTQMPYKAGAAGRDLGSFKTAQEARAAVEAAANEPKLAKAVTWEAIPGKGTGSTITGATPEAKSAFTQEAVQIIRDENGRDLLAAQLGIEAKTAPSTGAYDGGINPNAVTALPESTPIEKVRQYARAIQYLYRQDAVPFFRVKADGATEGVRLTFVESLDEKTEEAFFADLRKALTPSAGYTKLADNAVAVLNFDGVEGFTEKLRQFAEKDERITLAEPFRAESEYGPVHDWGADAQGEVLKVEAAGSGGSPLQRWLDDRRSIFDALLAEAGHPLASAAYSPMPGLTAAQRAVESELGRTLGAPDAVEKYAALAGTQGGRLLNIDEARHLSAEYAASKKGRTLHTLSTQKPSGAWIEQRYYAMLAETPESFVRFMAGGGGSGKTTVLSLLQNAGDAEITLDSVMAHIDKATARVEAALASGRPVEIIYVHRDVRDAARGVAERYRLMGRWIPATVMAQDHIDAQETILALADKYKDNQDVTLRVFDTSAGSPSEITVDELRNMRYTINGDRATAVMRVLPDVSKELQDVETEARAAEKESDQPRGQGQSPSVGQDPDGAGALRSEDGEGAGAQSDELVLAQEGARGRLRFTKDRRFFIDLFQRADLSTFLHESGHLYLEVLKDLASAPGAKQALKDDYATILTWLGSTGEITVAQHEQFARGFERYLMEGKAPSSELRRAFTRFKVWLTHIYRQVTALKVELTPEVRGVFDRLLATEAEIDAVEAEQNVSPMFADPRALLGEAEADKYLAAVAAARQAAEEELSAKMLAEVAREQEKWYRAERERVSLEIEAEVNSQPVYKALMALQSRDPDAPQIKISSVVVAEMETVLEASKKGLPRGITAEDGLHPKVVADMFGFKTSVELLDSLAAAEPRRQLIERLVDERMTDIYGDMLQETGRAHDEALKAVHNEKRGELLRRELEILAEKYTPAFKGLTMRISRRPIIASVMRDRAEQQINGKKLREIDPKLYLRAEAKAGNAALEAMLKGDFDSAFASKQQELLNHELFRAATEAREKIDAALERFERIARPDATLSKSRDIDLVNAARAVLASFGIGKFKNRNADTYLEQMARYDPDMYETVKALIKQAQGSGSYQNITYGDFDYIKDTVDALWNLSKRTRQILIDGKLLDREVVTQELEARIAELNKAPSRAGYSRAATDWEKTARGLLGMKSWLRRVESWVDAMDGGKPGVFRRYVWTPVVEATGAYRVSKRVYLERYLEIVKGVEKSLTNQEISAPELGYTFSGKAELLGALLHTGNESNYSKLLRGRKWGELVAIENEDRMELDDSRWVAFVARARAEGILTKADYDYAQAVWDLLAEIKPLAQKAHKDMYGYYFNEVTAQKFTVSFADGAEITYAGGYVPAVADLFVATDAAARAEREQVEKGNNSFMFPTAGRGFTKSRVEKYAAPLSMDVRFVPGHIDKVLRFVHIEPRVKDVSRIVMDRSFRKVLDGFDATLGGDMLIPWLQRAAQQRVDTPMQGWGGKYIDGIAREIRTRVGLQIMVGNVVNALQQPTGLALAAVKVKPGYLRTALWEYVRAPHERAAEVAAKSEFMSTRQNARVMEIQQTIEDMLLNPTKYEQARAFARHHGYFLQAGTQNIVDVVAWMGAYDEAIAGGASEAQAVRAADSVVRLTQGSFAPEDMSRLEAGTPLARAFTMFYSYFNMQANLLGSEFQIVAQELGLKKGAGRLLYVYLFGFVIPAVLSEALVKAASGDMWDDDDAYLDDVLSLFFGAQLRTATAFLPGAGPVVQAGFNAWNDKWYDDRITTSPAVSMIESGARSPYSIYKAIADDGRWSKAVKDTLTAMGLLTGLPLAPLGRPIGYAADVAQGKAKPSGPFDMARGLVTGKPGKRP